VPLRKRRTWGAIPSSTTNTSNKASEPTNEPLLFQHTLPSSFATTFPTSSTSTTPAASAFHAAAHQTSTLNFTRPPIQDLSNDKEQVGDQGEGCSGVWNSKSTNLPNKVNCSAPACDDALSGAPRNDAKRVVNEANEAENVDVFDDLMVASGAVNQGSGNAGGGHGSGSSNLLFELQPQDASCFGSQ